MINHLFAVLALYLLAQFCPGNTGAYAIAASPNDPDLSSFRIHQPALAPLSAFQKGIAYASWWHGEYSSAESDRVLAQSIKPLKANWLQIIVTCYQNKISSTRIQCKPETRTPTDADLIHVIREAHRLGLRVMLKPHLDLDSDIYWRGMIGFGRDEAAWKTWFRNYTEFIIHYAKLAQATDTDYFVVGTELVKTTHRDHEWREVIRTVRKNYHGPLTYAAHHSEEVFAIDWWDTLDAIGINPYYPLTQEKHPTVDQLKSSWAPIVVNLGRLSKKWGRQVILTEIGYQSVEGTTRSPWDAGKNNIEFDEQTDAYRALFEAFKGQEWWHGIFWWVWRVNSLQVSPVNSDFQPCNKPAEKILGKYYGESPCLNAPPGQDAQNRK